MALSGSSWGSGALRYSGFQQFTVESWVYPQAIGSNPATLFAFTGTLGPTLSIELVDQRLTLAGTLQCLGDQLVPTVYSDAAWQVPNDRWSHVAVVVTLKSSPQITIFINGALVGQATTASELLFVGVDSATIGAQAKGSSAQAATLQHAFFRGFLCDFKVWRSARSAVQIAADVSNTPPHSTVPDPQSNLWADWPMATVSGQQIDDVSGNGNHAQIIGSIMTQDIPSTTPASPSPNPAPPPQNPKAPDKPSTLPPPSPALTSTLSDIARGMQHVVNTTQEVLEQHYVRMIDRFLNPDGSARSMPIQLDSSHRLDVPLIALLNPPSLALDEMQVQMSVRIDEESVKTFPPPNGAGSEMSRSSFTVTMAPMSSTTSGSGGRPTNIMDITMKFKSGDRPEGVTRIINEFTARMLPMAVNEPASNT